MIAFKNFHDGGIMHRLRLGIFLFALGNERTLVTCKSCEVRHTLHRRQMTTEV